MPLPNISIDNFRAFKEKTDFEFAPITILTGANSSGKSSLIDALRIFQNFSADFTNPYTKEFWNKLINLKEDTFNYRIPSFKDLTNHNTDKVTVGLDFKCRFIGMTEDVTLLLEFQSKDNNSVDGILESLQYKNQDGSVFFSIKFEKDNVTNIEIDFGFFYEKFQKEIRKEIEYYEVIIQATPDKIQEMEDVYKITFSTGEVIDDLTLEEIANYQIENLAGYKSGEYKFEMKKKQKIIVALSKIHNDLHKYRMMEFYSQKFADNIKDFDFDKEDLMNIFELQDKVTPILNPYEFYYDKNNQNTIKIRENNGLKLYEIIKKDLDSDRPFYDKIGYNSKKNKEKSEKFVTTEKEKEKLKNALKDKLSIDILSESSEMFSPIRRVLTNPVEAIIFSDYDEADYHSVDPEKHIFWEQYFNPDSPEFFDGDVGETISEIGKLFYNKFIYENILYSIYKLKYNFIFEFIPSMRNISNNRFYSKKKGSYFEELIAEFKERIEFDSSGNITNRKVEKFINTNLKRFNIGDSLIVQRHTDFAVYSLYIVKGEKKINLVDIGYGISQFIPILLKIALHVVEGNTKIVIEEPETNLHPALQSKLADMFNEANQFFKIEFIIETHSEYLIRRFQGMVVERKMSPDQLKLYYFHHPDNIPEGELQVFPINIERDGALTKNFGKGFFDEAAKLNIALYNFTKEQHN